MIILTVSEIISIHEKLVAATGGSYGLRDMGLLESAVFIVQTHAELVMRLRKAGIVGLGVYISIIYSRLDMFT